MLCLLGLASTLNAQDPRERHYYYEILDPRHEPKPLVEGFARERVTPTPHPAHISTGV